MGDDVLSCIVAATAGVQREGRGERGAGRADGCECVLGWVGWDVCVVDDARYGRCSSATSSGRQTDSAVVILRPMLTLLAGEDGGCVSSHREW